MAKRTGRPPRPIAERIADTIAEALRAAARDAEERGDVGKDGGPEVWEWLRARADRMTQGGCA